jgi:hypothetical protein
VIFWKQYSDRNFFGDFRPVLAGKHRKLTGIDWKKSGQFRVGILLPCPSDFRCFPAGSRGIWWPESSTWVLIINEVLVFAREIPVFIKSLNKEKTFK